MGSLFSYHLHGLNIHSELCIPELQDHPGQDASVKRAVDVHIKFGSLPTSVEDALFENEYEQISENQYLLKVGGVANFLIIGSEIIVEPLEGSHQEEVRLYLLSVVWNIVLQYNDFLVLHSSTVIKSAKAIGIAGHSGAGKSTTALALCKEGFQIYNDDMSPIHFINNRPHIFPGISRLKVSENSLNTLGFPLPESSQIKLESNKYYFSFERSFHQPLPLKMLIFINPIDISGIRVAKVEGLEKLFMLRMFTSRRDIVAHLKKEQIHFKLMTALLDKIDFYRIDRPLNSKTTCLVEEVKKLTSLL